MLRPNRRKGQKGKRSKSHYQGTVVKRKITRRKNELEALRADICICRRGSKTIYSYDDENNICRCLHCRKKLS